MLTKCKQLTAAWVSVISDVAGYLVQFSLTRFACFSLQHDTVNAIVCIVIHGHGVTLLGIIAMQSIICGLLLPMFCGPCVLVTTVGPTKTDELIAMPYGAWTWLGPWNCVLGWVWITPLELVILGDFFRPIIKNRWYPACSRYSQPYLVGGSSNVAFHCQYCSNLLLQLCRGNCRCQWVK